MALGAWKMADDFGKPFAVSHGQHILLFICWLISGAPSASIWGNWRPTPGRGLLYDIQNDLLKHGGNGFCDWWRIWLTRCDICMWWEVRRLPQDCADHSPIQVNWCITFAANPGHRPLRQLSLSSWRTLRSHSNQVKIHWKKSRTYVHLCLYLTCFTVTLYARDSSKDVFIRFVLDQKQRPVSVNCRCHYVWAYLIIWQRPFAWVISYDDIFIRFICKNVQFPYLNSCREIN